MTVAELRSIRKVVIAGAAWFGLLASPAGALEIFLGGIDAESQYTGVATGQPGAGVLTFFDSANGGGPNHGVSTSCDVLSNPALSCDDVGVGDLAITGQGAGNFTQIRFEAKLDAPDGGPAPALFGSTFLGISGAEIQFWKIENDIPVNLLLVLDLNFIKVTDAVKAPGGPDGTGTFTLGNPTQDFGITSALTISNTLGGGDLAPLLGGPGTQAVMTMQLQSLDPALATFADIFNPGFLNANLTTGFGSTPVGDLVWELRIIPEPSTAALLGVSLLGLLAWARRTSEGLASTS